jgi:hypothetical protein
MPFADEPISTPKDPERALDVSAARDAVASGKELDRAQFAASLSMEQE